VIKCVVWDLDGTIWDGVLLEGDHPTLMRRAAEALLELDGRGVIQSVASKNELSHAVAWMRKLGIQDYFVFPQIHMGDKATSIKRISEKTGVRLVEIALVDDDPLELAMVTSVLPGVSVFSAEEIDRLLESPSLVTAHRTSESRDRRLMLQAEQRRDEARTTFRDPVDFLHTCDIRFTGRPADAGDVPRLVEMSERVNRMNTTGQRWTEQELAAWLEQPDCFTLLGVVEDKFGSYGIAAAAQLRIEPAIASVSAMWMSCRVGRRGAPQSFLTYVGRFAHVMGSRRLEIPYRPTGTNRLVAIHLGQYGLILSERESTRPAAYEYTLPDGIRPFPAWVNATCVLPEERRAQ